MPVTQHYNVIAPRHPRTASLLDARPPTKPSAYHHIPEPLAGGLRGWGTRLALEAGVASTGGGHGVVACKTPGYPSGSRTTTSLTSCSPRPEKRVAAASIPSASRGAGRSEERRVGKEWRSRWARYH